MRTKILATLGPATASMRAIRALVDAGVDAFRLNFSHGTHEEHGRMIAAIRSASEGRPVAIVQDLSGRKLRLASRVRGVPGDIVEIALPASVERGDPVLLADGLMQLEVIDAGHARVVVGGDTPAGKGVNLPSSRSDGPSALTEKDRDDLRFGLSEGVDWVALSFVRTAADLVEVKTSGLPVIAKFEKAESLDHVDEIVRAADAIMVARGDLGVEIPIEQVPMVQKQLIAAANRAAKPVITATQMLRSMVDSPLPTRAEATDVANAVLDGTDVVMLSEETAVGHYPIETVGLMRRVVLEAEQVLAPRNGDLPSDVSSTIAAAACDMAQRLRATAIVVPSRSGATARRVASHRPRAPVIALTPDESARRRLSLVWGLATPPIPRLPDSERMLRDLLRTTGLLEEGELIVVAGPWLFGQSETNHLLFITRL